MISNISNKVTIDKQIKNAAIIIDIIVSNNVAGFLFE